MLQRGLRAGLKARMAGGGSVRNGDVDGIGLDRHFPDRGRAFVGLALVARHAMLATLAWRIARLGDNDTTGIQQRGQHQKAKEGGNTDLQRDTAQRIVDADNPPMDIGDLTRDARDLVLDAIDNDFVLCFVQLPVALGIFRGFFASRRHHRRHVVARLLLLFQVLRPQLVRHPPQRVAQNQQKRKRNEQQRRLIRRIDQGRDEFFHGRRW